MATVQWADYAPVDPARESGQASARRSHWSRMPRPATRVAIPLDAGKLQAGVPVPGSEGLVLRVLPAGVRDTAILGG